MAMVRLKRAREPVSVEDGYRVLVDRLWPRGVKKEDLEVDEWLKEVAPSTELRRWFGHEPERWQGFVQRYRWELARGPAREALERLVYLAREGPLTLVYGARDEEHNNAVVLKAELERRLRATGVARLPVVEGPGW